jgi:hypothetical protein
MLFHPQNIYLGKMQIFLMLKQVLLSYIFFIWRNYIILSVNATGLPLTYLDTLCSEV